MLGYCRQLLVINCRHVDDCRTVDCALVTSSMLFSYCLLYFLPIAHMHDDETTHKNTILLLNACFTNLLTMVPGCFDRPLRLLDDATVLDLVWNGPCSLSKRLLTAAASALAENRVKTAVDGIMSAMVKEVTVGTGASVDARLQGLWALVAAEGVCFPPLARVAAVVQSEAASVEVGGGKLGVGAWSRGNACWEGVEACRYQLG